MVSSGLLAVALACGALAAEVERPQNSPLPLLAVMVDGLPYRVVAEALAGCSAKPSAADASDGEAESSSELSCDRELQAAFQGFSVPVLVVSSFPSSTTVSLAGTFRPLGMPTPPGYEARFYDWRHRSERRPGGKVRGGGLISYNRIDTYWADWFDWHVENPVRKGVGFLRPLKFSRWEIQRGVGVFLERLAAEPVPSPARRAVFFAYVSATDGAGHLRGPSALRELLLELGRQLRSAGSGETFNTAVFSDHGMAGGAPLLNVAPAMDQALRASGFRLAGHLGESRRGADQNAAPVVVAPYGLLTSAVFATRARDALPVAEVLATVDGVDLCVSRAVDGLEQWPLPPSSEVVAVGMHDGEMRRAVVELLGDAERDRGGRIGANATIRVDDPYGLLLAEPVDAGPIERTAAQWLAATHGTLYPDAPYRVLRAFDLVEHAATVVCSLEEGSMYGSRTTEWSGRLTVGRLRWTHGALTADASNGLLWTDDPALPEGLSALRHDAVLDPLLPEGWRRFEQP